MLRLVETPTEGEQESTGLDELAREGARRMLQRALEEEVSSYIERENEVDGDGRSLVVRNGKAKPRKVTLGAGTVELEAPRVNDKRVDESGERKRFSSKLLPPYLRRSPKVAEVLPILYLRGLSTGDFKDALSSLLGEDAAGLSATNIARLTAEWEHEFREFRGRSLSDTEYVYVWADGVHFNIRLEEERLCALVLIGVRADGSKELIAIEDGYRESTESWAAVLRDLVNRGMKAPLIAVGDGALGFWAAARDVWPETRGQRCWVHKIANVLSALPNRLQPKAKRMLHEAMYAETKEQADEAIDAFAREFEDKYPKAATCLLKDREALLTYVHFPAAHWKHLRTTNAIESSFATVKLRQRVTKGAGSRKKGLLMAYKLLNMAQARWRKISSPSLMPLVMGGVKFVDGIQLQQPETEERIVA
jgi:transposase-like protein